LARVEKSIEVNAPREKIWSLVNWDRVPEWYESIKKVEWTSEPKMAVGSTVHVFEELAGVKSEFDAVITEWVENEKVVWRTTSGNIPGVYIATLNPSENAFKITTSFDYQLPYSVFGKLMDKLRFSKVMQIESEKALQKMKEASEK
jgi:uncharacterized membrane protein